MNIGVNIVLFACMYMILPLIYFMLRNLSKPKKNLILGVTLPYEARQEQDVLAVCHSYRQHLALTCLALTLLSLGAFFCKYSSAFLAYLLTWLLAAIIAPLVPYGLYHRKLKRLKRERKWFSQAAGKLMYDTRVSLQAPGRLSAWLFAPPLLLSLIPPVREFFGPGEGGLALLYGINSLLTACCYLFYLILYRQKAEVINGDSGLSMALTQVRRYNWSKFWLGFSFLTALFSLGVWMFIHNNTAMLLITGLYTAIAVFLAVNAEFSTRKAQEKLTAESGQDIYVDDDACWILGMFYHNTHDKHFFINARVGINTTVNLARPAGKAVMALVALLLAATPFFGLWLMSEELTPLRLTVTESTLTMQHTAAAYSVRLEDVQHAELLETLPSAVRIGGTGLDRLLKGKFRLAGIGNCDLCLNPQAAPFMLIQTADKTYVLGASDSAQTRAAYALLAARL